MKVQKAIDWIYHSTLSVALLSSPDQSKPLVLEGEKRPTPPPAPRGLLAMSGDIIGWHNWG